MDELLKIALPHKGYITTPILIYLNFFVFLVMVVSGAGFFEFDADVLQAWGGNNRPITTGGEWWRLFTCLFLHADGMHIAANMVSLFLAGFILEPLIGTARFTLAYFVCGIAASLTSIVWFEDTVSIGASGAIFGLYGVALAFIQSKLFPSDWIYVFLLSVASMVGYSFIMGLMGGIDNAAHFGGFVAGYLIGLVIVPYVRTDILNKKATLNAGMTA